MRNKSLTIWVMVAVLLIAVRQGFGLTQFNDGGTYDITWEITDDVYVDWQAPGMQTTVNLLYDGFMRSPYTLQGYNNSRININTGVVDLLYAHDNSQVALSNGGTADLLYAHGNSQVAIHNEGIVNEHNAYDNSQITVMSGGWAGYLDAYDYSQATIMSGATLDTLVAHGNSQVAISGLIGSELYAVDNSQLTISSGYRGNYLDAYGSSHVTMSGGIAAIFNAGDNSRITMSGGNIEYEIGMSGRAIMTIYGTDFAVDGIPFNLGGITSILGGNFENEPFRRLTGTLANGDILDNQFQIGDYASITLVPEPATLLLFGFGAVIAAKRR